MEFDLTLTFAFPVILQDDRLQDGTLTLGCERLDAEDEDYSDDVTVNLEYPVSGEEEYEIGTARGQGIEMRDKVVGDEPVGRCAVRAA